MGIKLNFAFYSIVNTLIFIVIYFSIIKPMIFSATGAGSGALVIAQITGLVLLSAGVGLLGKRMMRKQKNQSSEIQKYILSLLVAFFVCLAIIFL